MRWANAAEAGKPARAPRAKPLELLRKILVAVDGSGPSVRAGEMAISIASSMKASVVLVGAIADAAKHADLIVMGSRGLGAVSGAALGSLSHRVIAETSKPVLIVH